MPAQIERWGRQFLQVKWRCGHRRGSRAVKRLDEPTPGWTGTAIRLTCPRSLWHAGEHRRPVPRGTFDRGPRFADRTFENSRYTVIARQSVVLRPRAASMAAILLLCGVFGVPTEPAHAQTTAPTVILPNVTSPPLPAPMSQIRLPSTAAASAAQPASDSRTVAFALRELGASGPMTMRGISTIQGLLFGIRGDEVVTDARLSLSGAMSPALLPDTSNVTVTLNEACVGTIPVNTNRPEFGPLEMSINPVFFRIVTG